MSVFHLQDHSTCTKCQDAPVPSLPCRRYENVKHFDEIPGRPKTLDRNCLPYSIVADQALGWTPSAYNGGAMIYVSSDSLSLPKEHMLAQLRQRRQRRSGSRGASTVLTQFTDLSRMSYVKERPLIIFPGNLVGGLKQGCLMATFAGGYIHDDLLKSFACGVWPTITHGDSEDARDLHIHTTPRWRKEPGFVLAIEYEPVNQQGLWRRPAGQSIPFHLDSQATEDLRDLCNTLANIWLESQLRNPTAASKKRTHVPRENSQYLSVHASHASRPQSQKPVRLSPRASPGGEVWPKKPREIPSRKGSVCTTATQKTSVSFASLFSSPSAPPQSSPILASLSTFNQMSISGSIRKAGGTPGPSRQGSRDWPTVDAPRVPVRLPRPQRQSSTSIRGR